MKYVMFVRQGQLVPIIFPDFINHIDIVNAASHIFAISTAAPVSAGACEVYCTSTSGKSTSTELPSNPQDAQTISVYDYCHGMLPVKAQYVEMVRQAFATAIRVAEDAEVDDLFDRSDWPPEKLSEEKIPLERAAQVLAGAIGAARLLTGAMKNGDQLADDALLEECRETLRGV